MAEPTLLGEALTKGTGPAEGPAPPPPLGPTGCLHCGGTGWIVTETDEAAWVAGGYKVLHPTPCPDCNADMRAKLLASLDGMDDEQRRMTFEGFETDENRAAFHAVRMAAMVRHGMVTLYGDYGLGKTHLLSAAVNQCRDAGVMAAYVTMPELMRRLRAAIDTKTDILERYLRVPVLALDELGREYDTKWSREQLFHLIDRRYLAARRMLTLVATNDPPAQWPAYVRSRLADRRNTVVEMGGHDVRPRMEWGQ